MNPRGNVANEKPSGIRIPNANSDGCTESASNWNTPIMPAMARWIQIVEYLPCRSSRARRRQALPSGNRKRAGRRQV